MGLGDVSVLSMPAVKHEETVFNLYPPPHPTKKAYHGYAGLYLQFDWVETSRSSDLIGQLV